MPLAPPPPPHTPRVQIPKTSVEADILAVFAPYGEVEQINILKSKGVHAGGLLCSWHGHRAAPLLLHAWCRLRCCASPQLLVLLASAQSADFLL
jgi:hypothetical protein